MKKVNLNKFKVFRGKSWGLNTSVRADQRYCMKSKIQGDYFSVRLVRGKR